MIHTYQCIDANDTARICLDMIARCAPKFMRQGGGGITSDQPQAYKENRTTKATKAKILRLARTGKYDSKAIAIKAGTTQSVAWKLVHKAGIPIPDGRTLRRMLG